MVRVSGLKVHPSVSAWANSRRFCSSLLAFSRSRFCCRLYMLSAPFGEPFALLVRELSAGL